MTQQDPWDIPAPSTRAPQPLLPQAPPAARNPDDIRRARLENVRLQQQIDQDTARNAPANTNDPVIQAQAHAMIDGRIPYPTGRAATDPHWQQVLATATALDPNFDENTHAMRRAAMTQFTGAGRAARIIGSANRLANHLSDLNQASEQMAGPNTGFRPLNSVLAYGGQAFEPTAYRNYTTAMGHVSQELLNYFRGGGGSLAEIHQAMDDLSPSQSLDERRAAIHSIVSLIGGAIGPLQEQYNSAFRPGSPRPNIPWLTPHSQQVFQDLGGVDFHIDQGDQTPAAVPAANAAPGATPGPNGPPPPPQPAPNAGGQPPGDPSPENVARSMSELPEGSTARFNLLQRIVNDRNADNTSIEMTPDRRGLATEAEVRAGHSVAVNRYGLTPDEMQQVHTEYQSELPGRQRAAQIDQTVGPMGRSTQAMHGAMLSLGDEAAGVGGAIENVVTSPFTGNFDPSGAYTTERDADRIRLEEARAANGFTGRAGEFVTSLASVGPGAGMDIAATNLGGRMLTGARAGSAIGAVNGFGEGQGANQSILGAGTGALEGGAAGAAIPVATNTTSSIWRAARGVLSSATGRGGQAAALNAIADAHAADFNAPGMVGSHLDDAAANGVPTMLADTGPNARGLLAASARAPGPGRSIAQDALEQRQEGLHGRVTAAIERDLGSTANPHVISDQLTRQAQTRAAPLYDEAYSRPGANAFVGTIRGMLGRPAMQDAMQNARRIAAEEGRNPDELGLVLDHEGNVSLSQAPDGSPLAGAQVPAVENQPTWQTLDYVKHGLDDVVERYRDPTSGRLNLDTNGRAVNNTLRTFVNALDEANPAYAQARAAYAGPTRMNAALSAGQRALNMNADDIGRVTGRMGDSELDMFRHGYRYAMAQNVANKGPTADVVSSLIGNDRKQLVLSRLWNSQDFSRFANTLRAEQEGFRTFRSATQGSQTAANLANDASLNNAVTSGAVDMMTTGAPVITATRMAGRAISGRMARQTRENIATMLSETNPTRLYDFAQQLRGLGPQRLVDAQAANARAGAYGVLPVALPHLGVSAYGDQPQTPFNPYQF